MQFRTGPGTAYPQHFFVGRHWHHAAEILFITKGSYLFEINLETYRLNAGDICFLNSGDLHQITGLEADTTHEVVIFDPHILEFVYPDEVQEQVIAPFLNHERIFKNTLCTEDPIYPCAAPLIQRLLRLAAKAKHNWYLSCKLLLLELLSVMTEVGFLQQKDLAWSAADKLKVSRYKEIVSYIEKHIPGIRAYLPEATYFLWIDFSPSGLSPEKIIEKCVYQAHVAVTRGTEFIEGGESFVRLNYACPRSLLMEALQRLEKVLNQ